MASSVSILHSDQLHLRLNAIVASICSIDCSFLEVVGINTFGLAYLPNLAYFDMFLAYPNVELNSFRNFQQFCERKHS